jgi:hypothetical protein
LFVPRPDATATHDAVRSTPTTPHRRSRSPLPESIRPTDGQWL